MRENESTLSKNKPRRIPWGLVLGIGIGGIAGFLFYYFIGCSTGTCPITSNPYGSILLGALMGAMVSRL
ncbi:MAG: hypothetical protein KA369_05295 [Spirochaetes bacterium]|nr:hypothetical protein [Spirochaetota bacterium]